MDNISISAASGMRARMESLEMLANNLANVETGGYKADREFYSLYTSADAVNDPQYDGTGTLPVIESHWTDLSPGVLRETGNALDLAIDGEGLFGVQTSAGTRYTRNGGFRVSQAGLLTASDGSPIRGKGGSPIRVASGLPVEVLRDGTVKQGANVAGQIEISTFAPNALNKVGTNYFAPVQGAQAKPANGQVLQGKLEQSNVGAAEGAVRLVAIMRQFEMLQKAVNIGNELNRRAIDDVARVTS
jgi:flagellar basal-body rod protein FlgF